MGQDGQILSRLLKIKQINLYLLVRKLIKTEKKIKLIQVDLKKKTQIKQTFSKIRPDIIVHLASNNPSFGEKNKKKFYNENLIITKNLFDTVFKINSKAKFIFCSSSQIFKSKKGSVNEKSKTLSRTDYTKFRIESDRYMLLFKKKFNIKYTNAILFNHDSIYRNKKFILPRIVNSILDKNYTFIQKILNENIHGDFSHAEDICNGIVKLIFTDLNLDKVIFSSNKLTSLNLIIFNLLKKNKDNISIFKKNFINKKLNIIGDNKIAIKNLKWKIKKNIHIAANELYNFYKINHK